MTTEHPRGRDRSGRGCPAHPHRPPRPPSRDCQKTSNSSLRIHPPHVPLGTPHSEHRVSRIAGHPHRAGTPSAELPEPNTLCITPHNPLYHPRSRCPAADGLERRLLCIYYMPDPALSSMCTDLPSPYKVSAVITSNLPMKRLKAQKA